MGFDIILKSVSAEGLVWKTKFSLAQLGQDLCTLLVYYCVLSLIKADEKITMNFKGKKMVLICFLQLRPKSVKHMVK